MKSQNSPSDGNNAKNAFVRLFRCYSSDTAACDSLKNLPPDIESLLLQLRNCSKADPGAFIPFFDKITVSDTIPDSYAVPIAEGIADYLISNFPSDETSDVPSDLIRPAKVLLHWLDVHSFLWEKCEGISDTLALCCRILENPADAEPLLFGLLRLAGHSDPESPKNEASVTAERLNEVSQHSVRGKIANSAIRLASNLLKNGKSLHPLLFPLLFRFATDAHPGVRAALLCGLADFGKYDADGAWKLSDAMFHSPNPFLWEYAEAFLCHQCQENFPKVRVCLRRIELGKTRGKISAWACLSGPLSEDAFFSELSGNDDDDAWTGVAEAFEMRLTHEKNRDQAVLIANQFVSVLNRMGNNKRPPEWFSRWLSELSGKTPLLADQIRAHL